MAAAIERPELALRSITSVFAAPVRTGPVEIDVTVLRRGRSMAQATATVRSVGRAGRHDRGRGVRCATRRLRVHRPRGARRAVAATSARRFATIAPERRRGHPVRVLGAPRRRARRGRARAVGGVRADDVGAHVLVPLRRSAAPRRRPTRSARAADPLRHDARRGRASAWVAACRNGGRRARTSPCTCSAITAPSGCSRANRARHAGDGYASLEVELWDADTRHARRVRDPDDDLHVPRRPAAARAPGARGPPMTGLLDGMRVLDLSAYRPMPHANADPRRPRRRSAEGRAARR